MSIRKYIMEGFQYMVFLFFLFTKSKGYTLGVRDRNKNKFEFWLVLLYNA